MTVFSVVIPWRNRPELRQTLTSNAKVFERHAAEVLVVNCGGDPDDLSVLLAGLPITRLRHIVLPGAEYNGPLARNLGAFCGTGRFVFFLDADMLFKSDIFRSAYRSLQSGRTFIKVRTVQESQPNLERCLPFVRLLINRRHMIFADGREARLIHFKGGDGSRCGSGLLFIDKQHFVRAGGFNSQLAGWGFDDLDFQIRVQLIMRLSLKAMGTVVHLTHGDETRTVRHGSLAVDSQRNMLLCFDNYEKGRFEGTYNEDVHKWAESLHEIECGRSALQPTPYPSSRVPQP